MRIPCQESQTAVRGRLTVALHLYTLTIRDTLNLTFRDASREGSERDKVGIRRSLIWPEMCAANLAHRSR